MRTVFSLITAATVLLLTGCGSSISVTSDFDPGVDFKTLKTFQWHEPNKRSSDDPLTNSLLANRVKEAAGKALKAKGFIEATGEKPDFYVYSVAGLKDKMNVTNWGYGYGPYWGPYPGGRNIDVSYYTEANLVVDIVLNAPDPQLAWRGIGTGVVHRSQNQSPQEAQARMDEVVAKILQGFPPTPGSK